MPDEPVVVAEPSSAQSEIEVPQDPGAYATWRQTGKLPAPKKAAPAPKPKPEASAASDAHKSEDSERASAEAAPDAESGEGTQEHRQGGKKSAEDRIRQLTARIKELEGKNKDGKTADASTAKPDSAKKPEAKPDGPPKPKEADFATYGEYFEALADWKAEQKIRQYKADQAQAEQQRELQGKLSDARKRYGAETDKVIQDTASAVFGDNDIPAAVKQMIDESSVLVDVLYVMGSKAEDLKDFVETAKRSPGAAIRKLVLLESLVQEELANGKGKSEGEGEGEDGSEADSDRDEHGRFTKPPEKKKPATPPPPSELSGRGSRPTDAVESAAKNDDFRAYRRAANARDAQRRRGE